MKKRRHWLKRGLPWLALAAAYCAGVLFYALYGAHNLDSDISSEMISAQLLNEEGSLTSLSQNWLYSTELRVVSPVPLYRLGLALFSSWHAAHAFAVACILLLLALSTLFMARETGFGEAAPWLAAMLVLPYSKSAAYIVHYGGFYAMHIVCAFVLIALVARCARKGLRGGKASFALLVLLSFYGGLGGVRMFFMLFAPMACAAALMLFFALKRTETVREGVKTPQGRIGLAALASAAFALPGYLIHVKALCPAYSCYAYSDMRLGELDLAGYASQLRGILDEMGLRKDVAFFSQQGVASLLVLAYFALILVSAARLLGRFGAIGAGRQFFTLTAVLAVLLGMTLVVQLGMLMTRYYELGILLLLALPVLAWTVEPCRNAAVRGGACALLAALFFFETSVSFRYDYTQGEVNYEMAADWLLEHGYTQGYATYWNANTLTEASDGRLELWALKDRDYDWRDIDLWNILQEKRHLTEEPQGRVFVLADEAEILNRSPLFDEAHYVDFIAWSYYVFEYDGVDEMRGMLASAREG